MIKSQNCAPISNIPPSKHPNGALQTCTLPMGWMTSSTTLLMITLHYITILIP